MIGSQIATTISLLFAISVSLIGPTPVVHSIDGVPEVELIDEWCGPAALAAVLQYHGEEITPDEIAETVYLPGHRGSLNLDLLLFARRRGHRAEAWEGTPDSLRRAVTFGLPVICMVRRGHLFARRNHFVVVVGYDRERGVWIVDGGGGAGIIAERRFESEWREGRNWMLLVQPTIKEPARGVEVIVTEGERR